MPTILGTVLGGSDHETPIRHPDHDIHSRLPDNSEPDTSGAALGGRIEGK
uniref:Uncharacterized protein n=1 Tax=viral metagenome TaxID=1070528 RepID=A0A6M3XZL1_9ZZZZ